MQKIKSRSKTRKAYAVFDINPFHYIFHIIITPFQIFLFLYSDHKKNDDIQHQSTNNASKSKDSSTVSVLRDYYKSTDVKLPPEQNKEKPQPKRQTLVLCNQKDIDKQRRFAKRAQERLAEQHRKEKEENDAIQDKISPESHETGESEKSNAHDAAAPKNQATDVTPIPISPQWMQKDFIQSTQTHINMDLKILALHEDPETQMVSRKFCLEIMPELAKFGVVPESIPQKPLPFSILPTLCIRFKNAFTFVKFTGLPCDRCGSQTTRTGTILPTVNNSEVEPWWMCSRIEQYYCPVCSETTKFYRVNHPVKIIQERKGRCGEYANAFTCICRSLGFNARLVTDISPEQGDHVWTEVWDENSECTEELKRASQEGRVDFDSLEMKYSSSTLTKGTNPRYVAFDSCEGFTDNPLVYETGWGKTISRVIAASLFGFYDVTQRYTLHDVLPLPSAVVSQSSTSSEFVPLHDSDSNHPQYWLALTLAKINNTLIYKLPASLRTASILRHSSEIKELKLTHQKELTRVLGRESTSDQTGLRSEEQLKRISGN